MNQHFFSCDEIKESPIANQIKPIFYQENNELDAREKLLKFQGNSNKYFSKLLKNQPNENVSNLQGKFIVGNDTRRSSQFLVGVVMLGLLSFSPCVVLLREVATPVVYFNMKRANRTRQLRSFMEDYFSSQIGSFRHLLEFDDQGLNLPKKEVLFDGANGVGFLMAQRFNQKGLQDLLRISLQHGPDHGEVNLGCGSEHLLNHKTLSKSMSLAPNQVGFTCDGDGDRLILFYKNQANQLRILNGDKILALLCAGFKRVRDEFPVLRRLKVGAISTLYSDGNLKRFVEQLGLTYFTEPTGVKNMFERTSALDISLLVEFNGHALVHFSDEARRLLLQDERTRKFFAPILELNCEAGDFMAIYFLLQFFMRWLGLSYEAVDHLFRDKVMKLVQVSVSNKNAVEMDERSGKHFRPKDLSTFLEDLMQKHQKQRLRIFVRKSGTEELVRILLEAECTETVERVSRLVQEFVASHAQINPQG